MARASAHPVRTLRDLVTLFEAAMALTVADPRPHSVHQLRTTARRIEAQLELLALLPTLPKHAKPAGKARKLLRKLRRAAGRVRDLDVQRDLVQSRSDEANQLRSLFKDQRRREAKRLIKMIEKHQDKLTLALEAMLEALAPAESLTLSEKTLAGHALNWYTHNTPASGEPQEHRQLHDIRKAAKLARYIAESAAPTRLARTFESLQHFGGDWHDWLVLSGIARHELGDASPLTERLTRRCERSLTQYRSHLRSLSQKLPNL